MSVAARRRHRYGNSVDGTTSSMLILESIETKKAMDPCSYSCYGLLIPNDPKGSIFFFFFPSKIWYIYVYVVLSVLGI